MQIPTIGAQPALRGSAGPRARRPRTRRGPKGWSVKTFTLVIGMGSLISTQTESRSAISGYPLSLGPFFLVSSPAQRDSYLGATTSAPKRPWPSSKGPAVKKSVFVGPLLGAPLPKEIAERPSVAVGGPSAKWSGPRCWNSPCPLRFAGSEWWIGPLTKL